MLSLSRSSLALLLVAGALGTLTRYLLAGWIQRWCGSGFPWGIFAVNGVGCFLFGFLAVAAEGRGVLGAEARMLLLTGFLGAFTTFSTFANDSVQFLARAQWGLAAFNILGQNVVGLAGLWIGSLLGRSSGA